MAVREQDEWFHQVELRKGTTHQIAWIAARGAKVGAIVELKDDPEDGQGWEVISVGTDRPIDRETALKYRDAYRKQREASDI